MKNKTIRNIALLLFSLVFVYGLASFSVYENMHPIMNTVFFSGSITQGAPVNIWYFVSHFLLADVYMKLYSITSDIPWYAVIMFFYVAVSLFFILYIFLKNNQQVSFKGKILPVFLILILATEFIFVFQYTRIAFALGAASTLALLLGGKESKLAAFTSFVLFIICLLTRHEAGVYIFLIQWLAFLLISNRTFSKTALFLNTAAFALIMGYIVYDRVTTNDYLKQFEPELGYQLLDRGNIVPLSTMKNAVDSAKYMAVINLITDQQYTSIAFLRSLVAENAFVGFNKDLAFRALKLLGGTLFHSMGLFIMYIGLLMLVLRQALATDKTTALKILLFNLSLCSIIVVTTYSIFLQFYTLDVMLTIASLILLSQIDFVSLRFKNVSSLLYCIIIIGIVVLFQKNLEYSKKLSQKVEANEKYLDELKKRYAGKILVPGLSQKKPILLSSKPFQKLDFSAFSRLYLFDADVTYIEPHYNAYLSKECNCDANSYTNFMDFLDSKKDSVRIISDQERIDAIKHYCHVVRGKDYNIVPVDSLNVNGNSVTVFTFQ
jgi:hypothetical protein